MVEKIKTDVDRLLSVLTVKKKFRCIFMKFNFFSISKPKVIYLRPFFYLLYYFPNFEKKILCTSDTNM